MKYHITEFAAILAAYAAGQLVRWKHEGYSLAGGPDPDSIVVQYPANGHCCGLFHTDGVTSSYDPADFQIVPAPGNRPLSYHDGQTANVGDTFVAGTWGTCRITELREGLAVVRNVMTKEVFELDSLSEADLTERTRPQASGRTESKTTATLSTLTAKLMKTENGYTRLQFVSYLRHTLIPDLRSDESDSLAEDFETSLQFITDDVETMHSARKALLAASAHIPTGANAAALVAASLKEIDAMLGYPAPAPVKRETPPQSRRCLEDVSHLKD